MTHEKALARAKAGTGKSVDFTGSWANEHGSEMKLTQAADGSLQGSYISAVSGGKGSTNGVLSGFVDGTLVSFVVHWVQFQAITAWVGQLVPGSAPDTVSSLWQMTKAVETGD